MKALLLGATGGCGSQVLTRLLERGVQTTVIVRDEKRLPEAVRSHALLSVVTAAEGLLGLTDADVQEHLKQQDAVISCLGHNMTRKGIWGKPRRLCADTTKRVCEQIAELAPASPIKFIVVNTEGVDRPDGKDPKRGLMECFVLWLLTKMLPPHVDNMAVAAYLHEYVSGGKNPHVFFCAVRPSDMKDGEASEFTLHDTLQNGIFNAGSTIRANVGEFMANLTTDAGVWEKWKNSYPQILDVVPASSNDK